MEDVLVDQAFTIEEEATIPEGELLGDTATIVPEHGGPQTRAVQYYLSSLYIFGNGRANDLLTNNKPVSQRYFRGSLCMVTNGGAVANGVAGICYWDGRASQYRSVASGTVPAAGRESYFGIANTMPSYNNYTYYFKGTWSRAGNIYFYDYAF